MKIFIISRGLPSPQNPMLGIFELDQAVALSDYGHEVVLIALDLRSFRHRRKYGITISKQNGIDIINVNTPLGAINKSLFYFLGSISLKKALKKAFSLFGSCDILHAHFLDNAYMTAKVKTKMNLDIPLIVTEHSSSLNKPIEEIRKNDRKAAEYAYKKSQCLITVSKAFAKRIENNFKIKSVVINNIVDTKLFYNNTEKNHNKTIDFVSVGNLNDNKRMSLLIKSFNRAFGNNKNITLTICGDGPEMSLLKRQINKYNLENIQLLGRITREEISNIFKRAKIFILLSKSETFGVAFIEAMAAGLPVISVKSGGPEDFINDDVGILIDDEESVIVNTMKSMLNNIINYDGEYISNYAKNMFSPSIIADRLTKIYQEKKIQ